MNFTERRKKCEELIARYYDNVPLRDQILDRNVRPFLQTPCVLIDAGCGCDLPLLGRYAKYASLALGVDLVKPTVRLNGSMRVVVGALENLPVRSESVDVVVSRSVFEHLKEPVGVFREINRVLRPRGILIFTTPNKYCYASLVASLTPEFLKGLYFRTVFGDDAYDTF